MSQCLRCSKPCEATSVFCETCRSLLRSQLWQAESVPASEYLSGGQGAPPPETSIATSPVVSMSSESSNAHADLLERITGPQPIVSVPKFPQTPPPPPALPEAAAPGDIGSIIDQALRRLKEAAQRIAEVEQHSRRVPRASRLAPLHDISADIQRQSTPLPKISKESEGAHATIVEGGQDKDLGKTMPDLWPWLQEDADLDENDCEQWSDHSDPLIVRHFPKSAETKQIEEEDLRRARAEGLVTLPIPPQHGSPPQRRIRKAFAIFTILAIAFLVVDTILLAFVFSHPHHPISLPGGPPSLTLSTNLASVGQPVTLHIRNFSSDTHVFLTHDIQEMVQLTTGSPLVEVATNGSADVTMRVDDSWGPGFHTIEAEGVTTRYTASATLQITGSGPTRPSNLLIGTAAIDLGIDFQGANTIQPLTLHNAGGGSISWAASSDRPWLMISPAQGVFSASQTITIAGERANLKPGDYKGTITFSSNVGPAQSVQVHMSVRPLPLNVGAVLEVIPPVLSFTALDGGANPNEQPLMVNNPGSQPLHWSLAGNNPINLAAQSLLNALDPGAGWLNTSQTSGVVVPHGTSLIQVLVNSRNLLPGVYTDVLVFTGSQGAYNSPQSVSISLTVQPRCGLAVNTGMMSFTAVAGHGNPSNRSLSLSTTASCSGAISWKAVSGANWLAVTPASGQLRGSSVTTIAANASILKAGTYLSNISFITAQNTQTVVVNLVVQPAPPPLAPIMGATPLTLDFNTTQGMAEPPGQLVTLTNTGRSPLNWHTAVNTLASTWLVAIPSGGTIAPGQTGQVTINVSTASLTPNTYAGQVMLIGTDAHGAPAAGSPQTITVNLLVLPTCTLQQPSLSAVAFSATQGTTDPAPQSVVFTASGNCSWPLSWQAQVTPSSSWLKLTTASGSLVASGQSSSMLLAASITGLAAGTYSAQIKLTAGDGSSTPVQGNSQTISVTLNVLAPCQLQLDSANLTFSVAQGQPAPSSQSFSLSESGNCAPPVSWTVSANTSGGNWLTLSQSSGTGNGLLQAGVNPQNLVPGTYTGTITVTASGAGGAVVQGSPQTITVTLTVTGYTLSGIAMACSDSTCTSTKVLPGASLNLVNTATNQTTTNTADGSGAFTFPNLALGSYTLTVTGSDGTFSYSGTVTLSITGNQANFSVNTFPK